MTRLFIRFFVIACLVTFYGCQEKTAYLVTDKAVWQIKRIPVIQGRLTTVGELEIDREIAGELKQLRLTFSSDTPLDRVVLMEKVGEELKEVFSDRTVSGSLSIPLSGNERDQGRSFLLQVQPSSAASLLEKIQLHVDFLEWGGEKAVPRAADTFSEWRLAKALRHHGDDGVHSFRIPGLATSMEGTLLAVYDIRWERSNDLQGHVDVGLSRSTDGGETWEPMKTIIDMGEWGGLPQDQNGVGDPAILVDENTGTIWVVALWMHGKPAEAAWNSSQPGMKPEETGQLVVVKSEDDGMTWSDPVNVTSSLKDPSWHLFLAGPGRGITMRDGTLVFAGQYKDAEKVPHSTIIYSKDQGATWHMGKGARSHTTEAQVVELSDGSILLNMRDDRGGSRAVMVTKDLGETWEEHVSHRSALVEPICMASIITNPYAQDAPVFFFSNPNTTDGRYNITIKTSFDEGKSWPEANQLLLDEGIGWGYTCLTMIDKDHLGILYESSQANMTFQIIPLSELIR
ncbi:MAG: exo-alpha-sialidase [Lunatimonas sp.]|uniref:sialidase family protein n=1 Tax=Lunatimonas sp. TaxID=2060141 RepID=UPI00263A75AD|nr:sialidase family protein [Lunatimonas sp.]MCC5936183.1 exo-alpha-sialidase [Lunatimonas sp.]